MKNLSILSTLLISSNILGATNTRPDITNLIPTAEVRSDELSYVDIAGEVQYWIFVSVGIIAIVYITWAGARLLWAPGNIEEMTSSLKAILYVGIGLAIIPLAYLLISAIINIRI